MTPKKKVKMVSNKLSVKYEMSCSNVFKLRYLCAKTEMRQVFHATSTNFAISVW
jgi:hypothetical protein